MSAQTYLCDHCGQQFVGVRKEGQWHFCNRSCLTAARRSGGVIAISRHREFERTCLQCGHPFKYTLRVGKKQYCDRKCAGLARRAGGLIAQKVDASMLYYHGVRRVFCDQERMKEIMLAKHGVENAGQMPGHHLKSHLTMKRTGAYGKVTSKIELAVLDALKNEGFEVESQTMVFDRPIDICVKGADPIYVQVDGVHWHGLDRPLEEIAKFRTSHDRAIYGRWHADRQQDEQFAEHGLKLVRITDREAREWLRSKRSLMLLIRKKLMQREVLVMTLLRN